MEPIFNLDLYIINMLAKTKVVNLWDTLIFIWDTRCICGRRWYDFAEYLYNFNQMFNATTIKNMLLVI